MVQLKIIVILLLASGFSLAEESIKSAFISLGGDFASFRQEGGQSQIGFHASLGKDISYVNDAGFWAYDFGFTQEHLSIRNKTWPTNSYQPYSGVNTGGFDIRISYLDFTLRFGRSLKISKASNIKLFIGPGISIPINKDVSFTKSAYQDLHENESFDFDYLWYDADPAPAFFIIERAMNVKFSATAGFSLSWRKIIISFCYWHALNETGDLVALTFFDKIDRKVVKIGFNL